MWAPLRARRFRALRPPGVHRRGSPDHGTVLLDPVGLRQKPRVVLSQAPERKVDQTAGSFAFHVRFDDRCPVGEEVPVTRLEGRIPCDFHFPPFIEVLENRAGRLYSHHRHRLSADLERQPTLLHETRLDRDAVACLHAANEIGKLAFCVPVLPNPVSEKTGRLIVRAIPKRADEPIRCSVLSVVVFDFRGGYILLVP